MSLVGVTRGRSNISEACRRRMSRDAEHVLNSHDALKVLGTISAGGQELAVGHAQVPIQTTGKVANLDPKFCTYQAASGNHGTVICS